MSSAAMPDRNPASQAQWTIEELSLKTGVTSRNIRAYQSRGLLPPPSMDGPGRVGLYNHEHLARLRLINRMQERGFSLAGIADLIKALEAGQTLEQVLGMESAVAADDSDEALHFSREALMQVLPPGIDFESAESHLREAGLLVREGNGYRAPYPALLEFAALAAPSGIPWDKLMQEFQLLQGELAAMAQRFVSIYYEYVWTPYVEAGMPRERLSEVTGTLRALRRGVVDIVPPLLRSALQEEIDASAQRQMPDPGGS